MALTTCKSFHFSPFTSEYNSDLSVASSSSSLWDYTLLQPISPAMCYCHIQATSGSYSTLQSSRKLEIIGFSVGKLQHSCRSGALCASAATLHHSPVWRRYDSSHGTIVFVWMGKRVWVWAYGRAWKKEVTRGKNESRIWAVHCHLLCFFCGTVLLEEQKNIPH